jgi:hypothetical protein
VKVGGLFRGSKDADPDVPRPIVPPPDTRVRVRITVGEAEGEGDAEGTLLVEIPTFTRALQEATGGSQDTVVFVDAPEIDFLPAPIDLDIEHVLLWPVEGAQLEMPVMIGDVDQTRWRLTACGPTRRLQRREFVRVDTNIAATVTVYDAEGEQTSTFTGVLLDLCEGGTRCLPRAEPPPVGAHIAVEFLDEDQNPLRCEGSIVRHVAAGKRAFSETALAIRFSDPEENGDAIRRMVFAIQLRRRQLM